MFSHSTVLAVWALRSRLDLTNIREMPLPDVMAQFVSWLFLKVFHEVPTLGRFSYRQ